MATAPPAASVAATLAGGMAAATSMITSSSASANSTSTDEQQATLKRYLADSPPTVVNLDVGKSFDALDDKLKWYAHHMALAAWSGTRILLRQTSPESESIYDMIMELHKTCVGHWRKLQAQAALADEDLNHFLEYAAHFLGNNGNYAGFGDTKIVLRLPVEKMAALAATSPAASKIFNERLGGVKANPMYFDFAQPGHANLGFQDKGHISEYYPKTARITSEEIKAVTDFTAQQGILPENTRLTKTENGDFMIRVASSVTQPPSKDAIDTKDGFTDFASVSQLGGKRVWLQYGDHSPELQQAAKHIREASQYAKNDLQKNMLDQYARSFETGSMTACKESQKLWVKDTKPPVETNLGFVETYRDPAGVRGEWEGWVAIVNFERTKAFSKLVDGAASLLAQLPWSKKDFESDVFTPPDFTSLEVISCTSSAIPAGINIPNFDDIRHNLGFKNVHFGNIVNAKGPKEPIPFLVPSDQDTLETNRVAALELQVGLHELLGHGSGKLLQETSPGVFNFDKSNPPISPLTNAPITSWYGPQETFTSVFGPLASSYEECRAESIAMVLECDFKSIAAFGFGDGSTDLPGKPGDILYTAYLSLARAGLMAVKYYDPTAKEWGQIHSQARFAILQVWLQAGQGFVRLEHERSGKAIAAGDSVEELDDLVLRLDRDQIMTTGRTAVAQFLQKIHVFKATADVKAAQALYDEYTSVDEFWAKTIRQVVLDKDVPRKVFVQGNTVVQEGKVVLKTYEPTCEGMIQSFAERDV